MFAFALFAAAALSFLLQPLVARQLLPLAGGAPAVWTTALVVFQALLFGGYLYAHLLQRLAFAVQLAVHLLLMGVAAALTLFTPLLVPAESLGDWIDASPVTGVAVGLLQTAGLPYFVLSTTAPLLQSWFARERRCPYWLYAASNAGSLLGLLAYPFAVEPAATLAEQRTLWAYAFAGVALLVVVCGVISFSKTPTAAETDSPAESLTTKRLAKWAGLAALTASLLASVTAHLSTDIAPMPLLWVVPLALYLLTYIITFAAWPPAARRAVSRFAPMVICFVAVALLTQATEPMKLVAGLHLAGLFVIGLLCHGELAADRPPAAHLTAFYLALAVGGVLGGLFNAVVAPLLFAHLGPGEYPLVLVLAALIRPLQQPQERRNGDFVWPFAVLLLTAMLLVLVPMLLNDPPADDDAARLMDRVVRGLLMFGAPVTLTFALVWRPVRFALCLVAVFTVGTLARTAGGGTLHVSRNFFGTLRVSQKGDFVILTNGTTNHGQQRRGVLESAMYYHRNGPVGKVFSNLELPDTATVGIVGLGCGAMASYQKPGQAWTFYEIDPGVIAIAQNPDYFTFVQQSNVTIIAGDARRKLLAAPDGSFDLLAIDAFSSDAVPTHLLTREAFALYLRKLKPDGRLLLHLSNRYLDLASLATRVLHSLDDGLFIRLDDDRFVPPADKAIGREPSTWMIVTRSKSDVARLRSFMPFLPRPGPVWTDDFTPLRGVWKGEED